MKIVKLKKLAKWTGYPLFAIICFIMFTLWTFPFDRIKDKIQQQLGEQFNLNVEMEKISSSFPFGIQAENVTITSKEDSESLAFPIQLEELSINPSIISTLTGTPAFSLFVSAFGGEINADIAADQDNQKYDIKLDMNELDFSKMAYFRNAYKDFPVQGIFDVETDLVLDLKKIKESSGFLEMQIHNGSVGPGKMTFELPKVRTGTLEARFAINKGKLEVEKFTQQSPDMQSDMLGFVTLNKNLKYSRVNLDYRFKLSDDLVKKHDVFQLALSAIKNAEGNDKYYYHTLTGPLTSARTLPAKSSQYKFRKKDGKEDKDDKAVDSKAAKKKPAAKKSKSKVNKRKDKPKKSPVKRNIPDRTKKQNDANKITTPKNSRRPKPPQLPSAGIQVNRENERAEPPDEPEENDEVEEDEEVEEDDNAVEEDENTAENEEDENSEPEEEENKNEDSAEEQDEPEED